MTTREPRAIDDVDRAIVRALQADGRRPFTSIAASIGISEAAVRQRYARLREAGVLQVVAVTNPLTLGYQLMALIGAKVDGNELERAAERISTFPETSYVVLSTGGFDVLVEVVCEDNAHLIRFLTEQLAGVEGVRETETFFYLKVVKENYEWGGPGSPPSKLRHRRTRGTLHR